MGACGRLARQIESNPRYREWRERNIQTVEDWTRQGLLEEIDPYVAEKTAVERFSAHSCCDGEELMVDILPHLSEWLMTNRVHLVSNHGGPLMVDPEFIRALWASELLRQFAIEELRKCLEERDAERLQMEVRLAFRLGYREHFCIYHVPCKMAFLACWNVEDQVRSAIRMKETFKSNNPGLKVGMLLQIDRGPWCTDKRQHVTRLFRSSTFRPIISHEPQLTTPH